jgi:hypothetical protein
VPGDFAVKVTLGFLLASRSGICADAAATSPPNTRTITAWLPPFW